MVMDKEKRQGLLERRNELKKNYIVNNWSIAKKNY
jgi:hypothetical protein